MSEFHFIRPWCLLLLLILVGWCIYYFKKKPNAGQWESMCDEGLREHMLIAPKTSKHPLKTYAGMAAVALAIIALAGPAWQKLPSPVYNETASLVIALDASLSMDAQDIKPSRMARAKLKVTDLLQQRTSGQTALIAYAAAPYVVSPLTSDAKTIMALVPSISTRIMPKQGSNTDLALERAITLLDNANAQGDILFISDAVSASKTVMQKAIDKGIRVSVIGVGTTTGAPIPTPRGYVKDKNGQLVLVKRNDVQLRSLAKKTGGEYSVMTADNKDLERTLSDRMLDQAVAEKTELNVDLFKEQGPWLLLPILLFSLYAFRRGALLTVCAVMVAVPVFMPSPALALEAPNAFLNKNQQGAELFADKDYAQSAETFKNKEWKAAAQYRNNDFEGVLNTLDGINTAYAHYNRGNAFFNLGQFDNAIKAYDEALALNPDFDDALYNKTIGEQAKKRKEQQNQQGEQNKQNQQEKNDSNSQSSSDSSKDSQEQQTPKENDNASENNQNNTDSDAENQEDPEASSPTEQNNDTDENTSEPKDSPTDEQTDESDDTTDDASDKPSNQKPLTQSEKEIEQATKQWLRKIPDAPQNLLRNQFANEYQRNKHQQAPSKDTTPW